MLKPRGVQLFVAGLEAGAGRVQQGARARIGAGAQKLQVRTSKRSRT